MVPEGLASTEWPATRDTLRNLGIEFDQWQQDLAKLILAKRRNGKFAAGIGGVVMSIPRQVGKTFLVGCVVFAQSLLRPGINTIWTSHHTDTSDETFRAMRELCQLPAFKPHVKQVLTGGGDAEIVFTNKSRIKFGARGAGSGFGRGKTKVALIVLDEFQHVTEAALENITPTANQGDNPIIFMMGTPPRPIDSGEAFKNKRRRALRGLSRDALYVEFSADEDADLEDRQQWRLANPSFPSRTDEDAFLRMRENLVSPESFKREALGIWDNDEAGSRAISAETWESTEGVPPADGVKSFGVSFSRDGSRMALCGAMRADDGAIHVELVEAGGFEAVPFVADWLEQRWRDTAQIAIAGAAGSPVLVQALRDRKVPDRVVHVLTATEYFAANAMFLESVDARSVTHLASDGQSRLDDSVAVCDKKFRGTQGAWGWAATTADGDETPVEAASVAFWAAKTTKRVPGRKAAVSY